MIFPRDLTKICPQITDISFAAIVVRMHLPYQSQF